jgi:hypothetical protein
MRDLFACPPTCPACLGTGEVCATHPEKAYLSGSCCDGEPSPCPLRLAPIEIAAHAG